MSTPGAVQVSSDSSPGLHNAEFTPLAFIAVLASLIAVPAIRVNPHAVAAFAGAAVTLAVWNAVLIYAARVKGRAVSLVWAPKKPHYIQACAQGAVFIYWAFYWPQVPAYAVFIVAQLLFAYAFDLLLCWSRRSECYLGFAQFPVIFSINLFLWFKPDYFYLQFLMVALGLSAKEMIRWTRDGRRTHIFNPSSLPLAVFSLALLASGKSGITWGQDIAATQFYPPHMYLWLFLIGLPGQIFFGVTSMTMSAVVTTWLFGRIYFAITGIYFFYDSYIPIAVFLGMHLLFNDPTTSPKTESGRVVFGALYGLSTVALYELLGRAGVPTFYDKLLQVPLMNLSVRGIDAITRWQWLRMPPLKRNLVWVSAWSVVFAALSATQALGDNFPGQFLPFWKQACQDGKPYACPYLADMQVNYCDVGSGWACNEAGMLHIALSRSGEDARRANPAGALEPFQKGCDLGFQTACKNLKTLTSGGALEAAPPLLKDYPFILRGSKGPVTERSATALDALACKEGWQEMCRP
jgi:hypothetical protein